ncbi:MAG: glycosyltransferase family 4 protein [Chloroflexi bacterium]|nr:glycosyltransferase family 4 protein [Chloroflexota bacterium]
MKIALVSTHATSEGGVPHYVASLARALAKRHEVIVYSSRFESLDGTSVRHRKIKAIGRGGNIFDLSFLIVSTLIIWAHRLKRKGEFDIIHSHVGSPFFSDVFTSHFYEHDAIARMKTAPKDMPRDSLVRRLRSRLMARMESAHLTRRSSRTWIVLSAAMKSGFIRNHLVPPESIFVIPNGVDSSRYCPDNVARYRDEVRDGLSLAPGDQVVLFLGGDWPRKGLAQAIEALSLLPGSEATLLVVGSGNTAAYRNLAKRHRVEDRVIFTGQTREGWTYYAASDVYLLPSLYEPFGLSILEAMASGLPVLVCRDAGAAELIHDGIDGLLIQEPRDVTELSARLGALLKDADLRTRLGRQARRTALQYPWDRVARETEEVYEKVLLQKRGGVEGQPLSLDDGTQE